MLRQVSLTLENKTKSINSINSIKNNSIKNNSIKNINGIKAVTAKA